MTALAISSDHHLAPIGPRNDFHADREFAAWLWKHHDAGNIPILAGDGVEILQEQRRGETAEGCLKRIMRDHPAVVEALRHCLKYYIRGNHDWTLREAFGLPCIDALIIDRKFICHGHTLDLFNHGRFKWIGNAATKVAGWLECLHPDADIWAGSAVRRLMHRGRYGSKRAYLRGAMRLLAQHPGADIVVIGHTHQADVWRHGYNTGTWTGEHRDSVVLPVEHPHFKPIIVEAV